MGTLTLYGSDVADATLTNAGDMATTTGGTETSNNGCGGGATGAGDWIEVYSLSTNSGAGLASVGSPSGHGWVYKPGTGTFATGNWSGTFKVNTGSTVTGSVNYQLNFYKYSGGVYTSIGSISLSSIATGSGITLTFAVTSIGTVTFGASDLLYTDLWAQGAQPAGGGEVSITVFESTSATAGVAGDAKIITSSFSSPFLNTTAIYESTSATQGVAGDMQITPSTFTPLTPTLLYLIPTNVLTIVQAADINQIMNVLQQLSGGAEFGHYFLEMPGYANGALASLYIPSLSRNAAPVSVSVDASDFANSGYQNAVPSTGTLTNGGFQIFELTNGAQGNPRVGGLYIIQY